MKRIFRTAIDHNYSFWVFGLIAIILLIISFFLPPTGEISPSVLKGIAELFGWASLGAVIKAIDKNMPTTIQHGNTVITIGKDKEGNDIILEERKIE